MKKFYFVLPIISIALVFAVWYIAAAVVAAEIIIPSPSLVFGEFFALISGAEFYSALLSTLFKTVVSFLISAVAALIFAVLSYEIKLIERLLYPLVLIVRSTPTMSLIFLVLIWFSSQISPSIVSFAVLFPMLYTTYLSSLNGVDNKILDMSKVYRVPRSRVISKVFLPHVFFAVFPDLAAALSFNIKLIVAAEAWAQTKPSLGRLMYKANLNVFTARLFAITLVAVLLGFILEYLLRGIYYLIRRNRYAQTR